MLMPLFIADFEESPAYKEIDYNVVTLNNSLNLNKHRNWIPATFNFCF